jgi:hypothetical protein
MEFVVELPKALVMLDGRVLRAEVLRRARHLDRAETDAERDRAGPLPLAPKESKDAGDCHVAEQGRACVDPAAVDVVPDAVHIDFVRVEDLRNATAESCLAGSRQRPGVRIATRPEKSAAQGCEDAH